MTDIDRIMDIFDGANPQEAGGGGKKIKVDGKHRVKITACKLRDSERTSAAYFVAEFELVATSRGDSLVVGNSYSWTCDITRKFGKDTMVGANDVAAFLVAAAGGDPSNGPRLTKENLREALSDDQPLAGQYVVLETVVKESQAGREWVQHTWSPATEDA